MKKYLLTIIAVIMMAFNLKADFWSGECGENVTWRVDTIARKLIISGTGDMKDYKFTQGVNVNGSPWIKHQKYLDTIVVEEGVTSVGNFAFDHCRYTKGVVIANTIRKIGKCAFKGCKALGNIVIPDNVTSIGSYAFQECTKLKSINIPSKVESIGYQIFDYCNDLETITVDPANPYYDSRENCNAIIKTETNCLVAVCYNSKIPNTVEEIWAYTYYQSYIDSIVLPDSLKKIGKLALANCSRLKYIKWNDNIDTICDYAFLFSHSLESIELPKTLKSIGYEAFSCGNNLRYIHVDPECVNYDSRDNCNAIIDSKTNVMLLGCNNTVIPNTVTAIGTNAFENCDSLISVVLPNGLTSIGNVSFCMCRNLQKVLIPKTTNLIESQAFDYCDKLDTICCLAEVPPVCPSTAFGKHSKNIGVLFVPFGTTNAYKEANEWKDFVNIVEFAPGYGVDENMIKNVSVYPNPASDFLNVSCENMKSLEILSLDGKQLKKVNVSGNEAQIDISDLNSGVYVYLIDGKRGGKFVKK